MHVLTVKNPLGLTGIDVPPVIFGTSCMGNLYQALPWETKLGILRECVSRVAPPVVFDSAGKYGAGLALEMIGKGLRELGVKPGHVQISNKLGWLRTPLRTPEPTFEPGAWVGLEHDAVQHISYDGIIECWRQGGDLLGGYTPTLASVHDPDEYLARATSPAMRATLLDDIRGAYRALAELKKKGEVKAVGIGAKDWKVIRELAGEIELDWVMFACSLTIYQHPPELLEFMKSLAARGVGMINSAVFHAGFLVGGEFFDYRKVSADNHADKPLYAWREKFLALCKEFKVVPAEACVQFGMSVPGVAAISLNTSKPGNVEKNVRSVQAKIPEAFWRKAKESGIIAREYPYLGK